MTITYSSVLYSKIHTKVVAISRCQESSADERKPANSRQDNYDLFSLSGTEILSGTINGNAFPGQKRGFIRHQKGNQLGDFLWLPDAP
jgi:hypothetical protein